MAFNLLDTARAAVSDALVDQTAASLGESPERTRRGFDAATAALLAGVLHKASEAVGAEELLRLLRGFTPSAAAAEADLLPAGSVAGPPGGGLLASLFGHKGGVLAEAIALHAGVRPSSATVLLGMVAPLVAGLLAREVARRNLDASGFMGMLDEQRESIARAVPPEVASFFGGHHLEAPLSVPFRRTRWSVLVPVALGALLLAVAVWWSTRLRWVEPAAVGGAGAVGTLETYRCESGRDVTVERLSDEQVRVEWGGQAQVLRRTSEAGDRFANEGYGWQALGDEGVLSSGGEVLERCVVVR